MLAGPLELLRLVGARDVSFDGIEFAHTNMEANGELLIYYKDLGCAFRK